MWNFAFTYLACPFKPTEYPRKMSVWSRLATPPDKVRSLIHTSKRCSDALLFGRWGSRGRKNLGLRVIKMAEDIPRISQAIPLTLSFRLYICLYPTASSRLAKTHAFCYKLLASYRLASEPQPAHGNMNKPRVNWHAHNTRWCTPGNWCLMANTSLLMDLMKNSCKIII